MMVNFYYQKNNGAVKASYQKETLKLICNLKFYLSETSHADLINFNESPVPFAAVIRYLQTYHSCIQIDAKTTILPYARSGRQAGALIVWFKEKRAKNLVGVFSCHGNANGERNLPKRKMQSQSNFGLP